jgi:hypothetical protein
LAGCSEGRSLSAQQGGKPLLPKLGLHTDSEAVP